LFLERRRSRKIHTNNPSNNFTFELVFITFPIDGLLFDHFCVKMASIIVSSYSFVLFLLYLLLVLFIALQLGRIVYYKHKLRSFQVGFLVQCFFWGLLRALFFLLMDFISTTHLLLLIIYWIPINIQYSTFSLLVAYYAYLNPIHGAKAEMRTFKRFYITVWLTTNIVLLVGTAVSIILGIRFDDPYDQEPDWLTAAHGYFTGSIFLVLVVVMAYHAMKVFHLIRHGPRGKVLAKVSLGKIAFVTLVLLLLFMSRCAYDFIMAAGITASFRITSGTSNEAIFTFVAFCAWEIVPTILVLVLFGTVNSTTLGPLANFCRPCFTQEESSTPYASVKYQRINSDPQPGHVSFKAQLFNDPKRYDSDDETSSQRTSPLSGSFGSPYPVSTILSTPVQIMETIS